MMHHFEFFRKLIGEKVSTARIRFLMQVIVVSFRQFKYFKVTTDRDHCEQEIQSSKFAIFKLNN